MKGGGRRGKEREGEDKGEGEGRERTGREGEGKKVMLLLYSLQCETPATTIQLYGICEWSNTEVLFLDIEMKTAVSS